MPGLAKTLAVKSLAHFFHLQFQRVQCTPDLIPADVLGGNIFETASGSFAASRAGLHRPAACGRNQPHAATHAIIAAGSDGRAAGHNRRYAASAVDLVFRFRHAESGGVRGHLSAAGSAARPLSDEDSRFGYPDAPQETEILSRYQEGFDARSFDSVGVEVVPAETLQEAREEARRVRVEPRLFDYIVSIVRATRNSPAVSLGASPRAAIALMLVAKAWPRSRAATS